MDQPCADDEVRSFCPFAVLYDYAWFVGFGVAFVLYLGLMRSRP